MEIKSISEVKAKAGNFIMLYSKSKVGKTTALGTLEGKTLIIDTDEGLISLDGKNNIDFLTFNESTGTVIKEIKEALDLVEKNIDKYDNICLDTLTALSKMYIDIFLSQTKDGRQAYGQLNTALYPIMRRLERFARQQGKNVIVTAQAEVTIDQEEKETIAPSIDGKTFLQKVVLPRFDGIIALEIDQLGKRKFITKPVGKWFAGIRDAKGVLQAKEEADFKLLFQKIKG